MFKGKKVKIRLKRTMPNQKVRVLVGKVLDMDSNWLKIEGRFYTIAKGETRPRIDKQERVLGVPRNNINVIRILPDDLDLDNLQYTIEDSRLMIRIGEYHPVSIDE